MAETTNAGTETVVLVTGGTGGIGKETATALARRGATVVVVGRDEARGRAAVTDIVQATGNDAVTFLSADLSSLTDVRALARDFSARFDRLDVLVNNAGALSATRQETEDGYELTFAMNVLSPFLLTRELLPLLAQSAPSRIVNVNTQSFDLPWPFSRYATPDLDDLQLESDYTGMKAYVRSKTANLLWTFELGRRLDDSGISVIAVNPGGGDTAMQREARKAAPLPLKLVGSVLQPLMTRFMNTALADAAVSSVVAATTPGLADSHGVYLDPHGEPAATASSARDEVLAGELWKAVASMVDAERDATPPDPIARSQSA